METFQYKSDLQKIRKGQILIFVTVYLKTLIISYNHSRVVKNEIEICFYFSVFRFPHLISR